MQSFLLTVKEIIYFLLLLFLYLPHYNYKKYRKSRKKEVIGKWLPLNTIDQSYVMLVTQTNTETIA